MVVLVVLVGGRIRGHQGSQPGLQSYAGLPTLPAFTYIILHTCGAQGRRNLEHIHFYAQRTNIKARSFPITVTDTSPDTGPELRIQEPILLLLLLIIRLSKPVLSYAICREKDSLSYTRNLCRSFPPVVHGVSRFSYMNYTHY